MWLKKIDWFMMSLILVLAGCGILMIYSADQVQSIRVNSVMHSYRQLMWLGISLMACFGIAAVNTRTMESMSYWIYGLILLVLGVLLMTGQGVERWIQIPGTGINLQPAEMAKLSTILALATYISNRKKSIESLKDMIIPFAIVALPAGLILLQPDLGTSLIFFFILFGMLYWSGVKLIYLVFLISPLISFLLALVTLLGEMHLPLWGFFFILLGFLVFVFRIYLMDSIIIMAANLLTGILTSPLWNSLKPYQQQRILVFFQPERDPQGSGWQIIQSKVAIGSGGLLGKGYLQGTQKNLEFLPAQHTDFIFPLVGEEFGFIGVAFILILFLIFVSRTIEYSRVAGSNFASLTAFGIGSFILGHVIINVGMTVGLMPITGLPLPLFSYGGSFLISCFLAIGILQRIYIERSSY